MFEWKFHSSEAVCLASYNYYRPCNLVIVILVNGMCSYVLYFLFIFHCLYIPRAAERTEGGQGKAFTCEAWTNLLIIHSRCGI